MTIHTPENVEAVAVEFTRLLAEELPHAEWVEMLRRNATEPAYQNGACASHDFLDANELMAEAMPGPQPSEDGGPPEDEWIDLWNAAWNRAREMWGAA